MAQIAPRLEIDRQTARAGEKVRVRGGVHGHALGKQFASGGLVVNAQTVGAGVAELARRGVRVEPQDHIQVIIVG